LQEKHPSALAWFESVAAAAKGKEIVVFLDYDGTLSPIVADPDRAFMSDEVSNKKNKNKISPFFSKSSPFSFSCRSRSRE
jgi:hypothetical protein